MAKPLDFLTNIKIFTILNAVLLKHNYKVQNSYSNNELRLKQIASDFSIQVLTYTHITTLFFFVSDFSDIIP